MKKISLTKLFLTVFCLTLGFVFIYSEPSKTFVFFVDFFKVDSCLDQGDSWNYEDRKCDDTSIPKIKTVNISNWKIYEDNSYDFKIKYPDYWANPQVQTIEDENSTYQYQVKFGTEKTLNGSEDIGFLVFVSSKKNTTGENACTNNCICTQMENNLDRKVYQEPYLPPHLFNSPIAEDYTTCYSYHFMNKNFEYTLIPILNTDSNDLYSLLGINSLKEFELAKNTFIIDFETIQTKAIEEEKARLEKERLARIAAEKARLARLKTCKHPERKPSYSKKKGKHMDEDCCPDPDEWPDPKCRYSAKDYSIMLKR